MRHPPELVIFDCDGVVVDSEAITARVLRDNLRRHGLELGAAQLNDLFLGGTMPGLAASARQMGADLPQGWVADAYEEVFASLGAEVRAIEGIEVVLDALDARGIPYAIGSNGPHRKMEITLGRTGLLERFQGRVHSREDVPNPKPAPDVYLHAARQAGVATGACVVVEDSPNGARAAVAAGMACFGFAAETPADRLAPLCDPVFDRMQDLPRLLGL